MTVSQARQYATDRLDKAGDLDSKTDASLFLCAILGKEPFELAFLSDKEFTVEQHNALNEMLSRREAGEPEQYIEGCAWFMGLKFNADPRALIPRQDTETLCEAALDEIKSIRAKTALDMCAGSGCVAIALAKSAPSVCVTACDISSDALELTKENARLNGVDSRLEIIHSDGFQALNGRKFDIITCNPPYLSNEDMREIPLELTHEPALALEGGMDGLDFYRRFASEMKSCLNEGGTALFEVGINQAQSVINIFAEAFPSAQIQALRDLNGIDRVVRVRT